MREPRFALHNAPSSVPRSTTGNDGEKTAHRLLAACKSVRKRDLRSADRQFSAFLKSIGHSVPKHEPAEHRNAVRQALSSSIEDPRGRLVSAMSLAVRIDLQVEAETTAARSATGAEWGNKQQTLQNRAIEMYTDVAEAAAATSKPQSEWAQHIELAALDRSGAYSWAMHQLGPAIRAQRRMIHLLNRSDDPHKLLSTTEQSEVHTQLGILLITRGSVTNSKADHTEAVRELGKAREISPVDPHPRA